MPKLNELDPDVVEQATFEHYDKLRGKKSSLIKMEKEIQRYVEIFRIKGKLTVTQQKSFCYALDRRDAALQFIDADIESGGC